MSKSNTAEVTRLFSNLEFDGDKFAHQPGSVLGSTALVAGTTVGAGILALPKFTLPSGVVPSTVLLVAVWLYALVSALLIAEVTLNAMRHVGHSRWGLLTMVENTLGKLGAKIAASSYLFLHYALLVAYIAQGGEILLGVVEPWGMHLPAWIGTTTFTLLFGGMMYFGRDRLVEKLNSAFFAIVIVSFFGLLLLASVRVNPEQFLFQDWRAIAPAISVMFVAMFYHNIIPVIVVQLEGDVSKIRTSIFVGSAIPLIMFVAWNAVILGSVRSDLLQGVFEVKTVFDPLQVLRNGGGGEWLGLLVSVFSEFAIVTSFIGFVYGLRDFFKDLSITRDRSSRLPLMSLILLPPMSLSALNPNIFFTALDYAGTYSISVLGGIIPALMAWKQRYQHAQYQSLVPGGKITLIVMIGLALAVIGQQIAM